MLSYCQWLTIWGPSCSPSGLGASEFGVIDLDFAIRHEKKVLILQLGINHKLSINFLSYWPPSRLLVPHSITLVRPLWNNWKLIVFWPLLQIPINFSEKLLTTDRHVSFRFSDRFCTFWNNSNLFFLLAIAIRTVGWIVYFWPSHFFF